MNSCCLPVGQTGIAVNTSCEGQVVFKVQADYLFLVKVVTRYSLSLFCLWLDYPELTLPTNDYIFASRCKIDQSHLSICVEGIVECAVVQIIQMNFMSRSSSTKIAKGMHG